ncbi:unnamed protein product [Fraxinus pennsylvanica]|uniref:Uncharacterized protein n=1 Tax=Fraxinus pennsylvanica TaxID=56036 RepID=A0AAD1YTI5_9LAMI|nr:unnamed protein product [Fraxinus pennsylvanica]
MESTSKWFSCKSNSSHQIEGKNHHKMSIPPTPLSVRSSAQNTPALHPFSPAFSRSTPYSYSAPYSIPYEGTYDSDDEDFNGPSHPAPSQWHLLSMNTPEWGKSFVSVLRSNRLGICSPINAYCVGALIAVYFRTDKSSIASHARGHSLVCSISPEQLFQAFLALLFTAYTIAEAGSMTKDLSRGSNAVRSVFAILDRKSEIDPENSWQIDAMENDIKGRVELRNVFIAFPSRPDQLILKGLNLKIGAGTTFALVDQSGSGNQQLLDSLKDFTIQLRDQCLLMIRT